MKIDLNNCEFHKSHPDDEGIDEIHIKVVPRYKTSDLSGNEWRTSAVITLLRKGEVILTESTHRIEDAAAYLPWILRTLSDRDLTKKGLKGLWSNDGKCDQPSCSDVGSNKVYLKREYSEHGEGPLPLKSWPYFRNFCIKHRMRGDGSFEDSDRNYTILRSEVPLEKPHKEPPSGSVAK